MAEYEPLDLSSFFNAGIAFLGLAFEVPLGPQQLRGLPFAIGGDPVSCTIALGQGGRSDPLAIPVGRSARTIVVAHRLLDSGLVRGGPAGRPIAEYVLRHASGEQSGRTIRERFEIALMPTGHRDGSGGHPPALALPDRGARLPPRRSGEYARAGQRLTELDQPPPTYSLWAWANPRPDDPIDEIRLVPLGPRFVVGAITLGHPAEHPLRPCAPRVVALTVTDPATAARPFDLALDVDRGAATFAYPLPARSVDEFLGDPQAGFGEAAVVGSEHAYARVGAIPSATVTVRHGTDVLGAVGWDRLEAEGEVDVGRARIRLVDQERNWVRTTVVDDATGEPIACRVHFGSPDGVPYQPHGHPAHLGSDLGTWHVDVGGDVRLGRITYAYIDGTCEGWLPRGEVLVDVARGFEYEPLRARVPIDPAQRELVLRLRRWRDQNAGGWYSGDTHVHFVSTQGAHLEARGEDLNVVNLLQSQWGELFTNTEDFTGEPSVSRDGRTIVYASQENRQHFLGHLGLLGLKRPVMPWCSDGPSEAELGGTLETTLADWADRCHAQGGTVIQAHHPVPNGEPAALIATGRLDAVELLEHRMYPYLDWYRYLNGGYRLPLVGGTDKMSGEVPIGLYRTYVRVPRDEPFTYESWCRSLAAGRTFATGGPLLTLSVEGADIGDTLRLPAGGGTVEVEASAASIFPIHSLQLVERGRVIEAAEDPNGARRLHLRARLRVTGDTWIAARAGGPGFERAVPHHDAWGRGIAAHTSPVYVTCGEEWSLYDEETARYMLTLIDASLAYIGELAVTTPPGRATHHHGEDDHRAYLERPFHEARAAIARRSAGAADAIRRA